MLTELVTDRVYVFDAPTNSGVIVSPASRRVLMIDSGIDDSQARKVYRQVSQELGLEVTDVFTTHAHADHFGGHHWLQKKGVQIHAPIFEEAGINNPILMPYGLFGGARPPADLQNKFLKANEVSVDYIYQNYQMEGFDLSLFELPGHTLGQMGVICGEVFFVADALFTPDILRKHHFLPFNVDLVQVRTSLEQIEAAVGKYNIQQIVPGHGQILQNKEQIRGTILNYRDVLNQNAQEIKAMLEESNGTANSEDILAGMLHLREAEKIDKGLFFLFRAAVNANLVYLEEAGEVKSFVKDGKLVYSL